VWDHVVSQCAISALAIVALIIASPVAAQQQGLEKNELYWCQGQRNFMADSAMNNAAAASRVEAEKSRLEAENAKLKAEIEQLKKKDHRPSPSPKRLPGDRKLNRRCARDKLALSVDVCNMALSQIAARTSITSISPSRRHRLRRRLRAPLSADGGCLRAPRTGTAPASQRRSPSSRLLPAHPRTSTRRRCRSLPPDCLKARFIVPSLTQQGTSPPLTTGTSTFLPARLGAMAVPFTPTVDLDSSGSEIAVILTDIGTALTGPPSLVYTRRLVNIGLWDAQFFMGAKPALATWLLNPVNASAAKFNQFRNTPVGWATGAPLQIFRACKASRAVPTRSVFRVGKTAIGDATPVPPCKRFRPPYSPDAIRFPSCRSFAARYRFALHSEACCGKNTGAPACRNGRVRG
jgi:hypothetical protein